MCEKDAIVTEGRAQEPTTCMATAVENEEGGNADDAPGSAALEEPALKSTPEEMVENTTRELESVYKKLLAESLIVFHDKRSMSRQLATQVMVRMVGRLAVVQGADDIQAVVDKLHVPHPSRSGVDAIITDLDPKVPKLMEFLRMRSLRPGLGKLPIVAVIVVVDVDDPRPELLASAIESGVDAIMRRPLERGVFTSCVGEVLRRHASVEFVYKDVVGEVETFNYPRFLLEGFHFLGATGESSLGAGDATDGFNDIVGEAVRTFTLQTGLSGNESMSMTTAGSSGWAQDASLAPTGGSVAGNVPPSGIAAATAGLPLSAPPAATTTPTAAAAAAAAAALVATPTPLAATTAGGTAGRTANGSGGGSGRVDSGVRPSKLRTSVGKVKMVNSMQGGHVKISAPRLRPRLYLYPGDKGYVGHGSTTGPSPSGDGGGGGGNSGCGPGGVGVAAANRRAESERQVSYELAPFVKRRAPVLGDPATSAGLHKGTLARTMRLVENTFSFTKGQDAETAWRAKGRSAVSTVPGVPSGAATATSAGAQNDDKHGGPAAPLEGAAGVEESWKGARKRTPRPESGNPVSQKKIFIASGTQGRRAATRTGMFDEVTRSQQTNINPTEIASTADLKSALGVGMTGDSAARVVIGRMMKKRVRARRLAARLASNGSSGSGDGGGGVGSSSGRGPRSIKAVKGIAGSGAGAGFLEAGVFKTVLSSLAKKRLREGLQEIRTNPTDVLRCGFVEVEPARYGSTALGCHLIKGWAEQTAGNKRRALGHYRKAVACEPENVEALFCKAVVSAELMELFDALRDFSAAISFKLDETTKASLQRGLVKKRAVSAPGNGRVTTTAGSSKNAGFPSRGAATPRAGGGQTYERWGSGGSGESNVGLAHLYGNRALVHVCLGDDASALDDLDRAVARDTRNITYRSNRALILRRVGDFRGAQQDYSRIRALQTLQQAAADRIAARTHAAPPPAAAQQQVTTALAPPPPAGCAFQQGATAEPPPAAENKQSCDREAAPQSPQAPAVDSVQPERNGPGAATLPAPRPRPSTSPSGSGLRREQGSAAGKRGNSDTGDGPSTVLTGGEVAATATSTTSGRLAGPFPVVATSTTLPTNTTSTKPNTNATSCTTTHGNNTTNTTTTATDRVTASSHDTTATTTTNTNINNNNTASVSSRNNTSSSPIPATGDKIDTRPSEEWSDQFRDRRLMEDTFRRRILLRKLFSPDDGSDTEYLENRENAEAGAGGKRGGSGLRKSSGQGASLGEFKTSMGLSAKGGLFDDLFCRPSNVDEALTTHPGRRSPEQVNHVVEALSACPMLVGLDKDTLAAIGNAVEYRVLEKMAPVFLQGEETDAMAIVLSGWVAVKMRRADLSVVTADELGPGDTFGEACMLEEHRMLASRRRSSLNHDDSNGNDEIDDTTTNNDATPRGKGTTGGREQNGGPPKDSSAPARATTTLGQETELHERGPEAPEGSDTLPAGAGGPNPNVGKSMETYQTLEPTRLVLILKADFHRIPGLLEHCSHAFKRRLEAIKFSGLFKGWDHEDLMRLARMSRIHRHASKSVLLMQRKEPSHLHIVLSGTCTVTKYPDRLAAVRRKINEIGAALYRITSKYAYHRDVRTQVATKRGTRDGTPAIVKNGSPLNGSPLNGNGIGVVDGRPASAPAVGGGQGWLPRTLVAECTAPLSHVTSTEVRRTELEREMRKWKRTLALIRRKDGDVVDTSQTQNVGMLQSPQFFGEMCLLVPDGGEALGTVSTDTLVETVSMSKFVLQTFHVTDTFLQGVRQKSSIYPEDINLAKAIEAERWWEVRRRELVLETLIGPAAAIVGGGAWKHKNQWLIRKRPKRSATST